MRLSLVALSVLTVPAMPPRVRCRDDYDVGDHPTVVRPRRHANLQAAEPATFDAGSTDVFQQGGDAVEAHQALHAEAVATDGHFVSDPPAIGALEQRDAQVAAAAALAEGADAAGEELPQLAAEREIRADGDVHMQDAVPAQRRGGGRGDEAGPSGYSGKGKGGKGGKGGDGPSQPDAPPGGKGYVAGKGGKGRGGGHAGNEHGGFGGGAGAGGGKGHGGRGHDEDHGPGDADPNLMGKGGGKGRGGKGRGRGKGGGKGGGKGKGRGDVDRFD